jgi:hypothetical protein
MIRYFPAAAFSPWVGFVAAERQKASQKVARVPYLWDGLLFLSPICIVMIIFSLSALTVQLLL